MQNAPRTQHRSVALAMAGGSAGFLARTYFRMRPFLPRSACWALRRFRIPHILRQHGRHWPVDELAGTMPKDWPGWPFGKVFALVLTHDVESAKGVQKVEALAELEMSYGLRSSYNFIPAGPYPDPVTTRTWLHENGFEIGVHDLNHDGHLYESRAKFAGKANRINDYLKQWQAVGFRSGFMLHQLDWLHNLDITYDSSTFDTDPFEPQPEGTRTIFPFEVNPPAGSTGAGYVELSYTLPQDSTLFILLQEQSAEIWLRKLDWIVHHGGMALVNIHPDYIDFSASNRMQFSSYPVGLLREFLDYIHARYDGMFWNPLARDLVRWYRQSHVSATTPCFVKS